MDIENKNGRSAIMKLTTSMEESTTTVCAVLSTRLNSRRNLLLKRGPWLVTDDVRLPTRWFAPCSVWSKL
ncbi:hypothetical protein BGAL_0286g00110 [Botrytis galanthina]|uniref:Uncharacterized protein n=1 Tax=Botrytis galanthina TaxID=278940 RepID=A0A4S8QRM4_9HELO|nr:hypothetical protein BGAL_0286g00110 [Botrytis galanthina]